MLTLALCWTALAAASFCLGAALLGPSGRQTGRAGDRFALYAWTGLLVLSTFLLVVSTVVPLATPLAKALAAAPVLLAVILGRRAVAEEIRALRGALAPGGAAAYCALLAGLAYACSRPVHLYDTGLYHWGVIKWLSQWGSVYGMSLIHSRFGFTSSWFTIPALLNGGPLEARTASLMGGLAMLIYCIQLIATCARVASGSERADPGDWFFLVMSIILLPFLLAWGVVNSPSPDLPVAMLTVLVPWAMIAFRTSPLHSALCLAPVLLAAGAVPLKLSAAPLLAVALGLHAWRSRLAIRGLIVPSLIAAAFVLPLIGVNIKVSGCPLYPSPLLCLDCAWGVGANRAAIESRIITEWARWSGMTPANASLAAWLAFWPVKKVVFALLVCSSAAALLTIRRADLAGGWVAGPALVGAIGVAYVAATAPTIRFGYPYLVMLPAVLAILRLEPLLHLLAKALRASALPAAVALGVCIALSGYLDGSRSDFAKKLAQAAQAGLIARQPGALDTLGLPPRILDSQMHRLYPGDPVYTLSSLHLAPKDADGFAYSTPTENSEQCWNAELPCTPDLTLENVRLLAPAKGLAGGFGSNSPR